MPRGARGRFVLGKAMRNYARVRPQFWIGETGRNIRNRGQDHITVALYLMTCPSSTMIGLYYLPVTTLALETGFDSPEGALRVLRGLSEAGFAHYDEVQSVVWVPEMARYQIEETLKPKDSRVTGVKRELESYRKARFFSEFVAKYGEAFPPSAR